MGARKILVVEDEATIAASIAARLRAEGFEVSIAADGPAGVDLFKRLGPDLVVLDVMLPEMDGLEVCRRIQRDHPVPVLMLTALDSESDLLIGLGVGADDYLTKPFSPREMVARVKALLRRVERSEALPKSRLHLGDVEIDPNSRQVLRRGERIHLTPTEFDLLWRLAARPDFVFSRERLLTDVWGYEDPYGARTVDSHIAALRRKLGPDTVRTVHGVGYASGSVTP
jgi:DNA-binding response OmpR family regulator